MSLIIVLNLVTPVDLKLSLFNEHFGHFAQYTPVAKGFDKKDGKIVLRRIACDITKATFKYWKFPTISLPFLTRKKGGYLDFLYLDEDMRITKGNNGGLFVHFRPEFIKKVVG